MKPEPKRILRVIIAPLVALAGAALFHLVTSPDPALSLGAFFGGPFQNWYWFGKLVDDFMLILVASLAFVFPWRVGAFYLGGEGNASVGALVAAEVGLSLQSAGLGGGFAIVVALVAAVASGVVIGGICALLREKLGISELISSFLLASALVPFTNWLVSGPLRDQSHNLLSTPSLAFGFAPLFPPSPANAGAAIVLVTLALLAIVERRTLFGFERRIVVASQALAEAQRISAPRIRSLSIAIGGGLFALCGALACIGTAHADFAGLTNGLAWNGVAAALLGAGGVEACLIGAFIISWMDIGSQAAMIQTSMHFEFAPIVQGIVMLLVSLSWQRTKKHG